MSRWPAKSQFSLRIKVSLAIVLPLICILGLFTIIEYRRHRAALLSNLSLFATYSAEVVEDNLLHQMLESDFTAVQDLLDKIGARNEFEIVYILDTSGKVIFAPEGAGVGLQLDNKRAECQPCHRLPPEERPGSIVMTNAEGQRVFRSMHPFENDPACTECHDSEDRIIGLLLTDISMAPIEGPLAADLRESLLWWGVTILVTILVVNLVISRSVFQRLQRLSRDIAGFGQGRMPELVPENGVDEISQLTDAFRTMTQKIEQRQQENQRLSSQLQRQSALRGELLQRLITAQEDERKRVARELHDDLGQTLSGLALRSEALGRFLEIDPDHPRAREQLGEIQSLIQTTTAQMYDIILDLRPSALDDLGLIAALRSHSERQLEASGLKFGLEADSLRNRLPAEIETAVFRIFQEALNNTLRHAEASHVWVKLACNDCTFAGTIEDDGRGFRPESINTDGRSSRGLGLLGIRERVIQCGGQLEIDSQPGNGTRIKILIPLPEECCE